ncbi:MAG: energy-coupled thiamine transporter ThiT [Ruminococcus sp.]|nr:energy-coupled thiamine transporter ThiT [Ruminococcus sp.]
MVEGAVVLALSIVLSFVRPIRLQWGGSVTLVSMMPLCLFSIRYGVLKGVCIAFLYSLFQFAQGLSGGLLGYGLSATMLLCCILFDYILAYTSIGLAGAFRKYGGKGRVLGIVFALSLRFAFHIISGVVVWKSVGQLWNSKLFIDNSLLYSFVYNGAYMLPEILLTTVFAVVLMKNGFSRKYFVPMSDQHT